LAQKIFTNLDDIKIFVCKIKMMKFKSSELEKNSLAIVCYSNYAYISMRFLEIVFKKRAKD